MNDPSELGELFDPKADLSICEHFRPHWSQAGAIVFITFRTADSIPQEVLHRWNEKRMIGCKIMASRTIGIGQRFCSSWILP